MYQLIYISSATKNLARDEFLELVALSKSKNDALEVTGVLMFKDGNFMQVLEGEQEIISKLYSTIRLDSRHTLVSIIQEGPIGLREYSDWSSTYFNSEEGVA
jgi:uncharacterized Fe-S cluster-containing radical SAM superfamily protein